MKFLFKVLVCMLFSISMAKANILSDFMNMTQNQSHNSRNGWVKVSIPDDISDKALTSKLAQYPSIAVRYLNQHEDRINGVQNNIYETLMNTNSESQYRKYFKLGRTLGLRDLPSYNNSNNGLSNFTSRMTGSRNNSYHTNENYEDSDEETGSLKVPGLY